MKKKRLIMMVIALAAGIGIGAISYSSLGTDTLAYMSSSDEEENKFTDGKIKVNVREKVDAQKDLWDSIRDNKNNLKEVHLDNEGSTVHSLVRIAIIPRWVSKEDESMELPWAGNVDCIQLEFKDKDGNTFLKTQNDKPEEEKWIADGESIETSKYFYYNQVLIPESETEDRNATKSLLNSFKLDFSNVQANLTGSDNNVLDKYKNYNLIIDVKAETVVVNAEAVSAAWGIDMSEKTTDKIGSMLKELCEIESDK